MARILHSYFVENIFQFFDRHVCFGLPSMLVPAEIKVKYILVFYFVTVNILGLPYGL